MDFGRDSEIQMAPKIKFFRGLEGVFFEVSFSIVFGVFSSCFFDARTLKNRAPVEARAKFLQNRVSGV